MLMFTKIKIILLYSLLLIWFIPRYHNCESIENTDQCVKSKIGTKACEGSEMQGPTMALVPYNQNNDVLSIFNQPEREFNFAGQKLKISQDWNKLGVAAVVWDAAIVLCEYMEAGNVHLVEKNVIELGAGSGIVGIVSTLLGAHTTITDLEKAIPYLTEVVNTNLPERFEGQFSVQALDWRENLESRTETYDVILGADIIYIEETFPDLLRTIDHLSDKDTLVYISCRIRYTRDSNFLQMLSEVFDLKKVHVDRERDITIYKGKKKTK